MKEQNGGEYSELQLQEKDSETFDGKLNALQNQFCVKKINQFQAAKMPPPEATDSSEGMT